MSKQGAFAVARSVFEHDFFACEPFTEREAWVWLIGAAVWKPHKVRVGRRVFSLSRGQAVFSIRFLATRWKWSSARVHRFLDRLKSETMIETLACSEATQITICNYDKYQFKRDADETASETPIETPARRPRDKEEELNKRKNAGPPTAPLFDQVGKAEDAELFARGKQVLGNGAGGLIASLLKSRKGNVALARSVIEQASTKENPREYVGRVLSPTAANERHGVNDPMAGII